MATFTPPTTKDNPAFLPESTGPAKALFRFYPNRARYINVFALSNGTFVQDTASPENSNTNIPYPWNPNDPSGPYSSTAYGDYTQTPPQQAQTNVSHDVWITKVYFGPTYVSDAEAAALTAAGYGALIT